MGRLVTNKDYEGRGNAYNIFQTASNLNRLFAGYAIWADSNTMHPTTQNLNDSVKFHTVGFSPLKFFIPNYKQFKNQVNREGNPNASFVYKDGRVSTTLNLGLLEAHKKERNPDTCVVREAECLQEEVLEKYGLFPSNFIDVNEDLLQQISILSHQQLMMIPSLNG